MMKNPVMFVRTVIKICENCYKKRKTCEACGKLFFKEDGFQNENGNYLCNNCHETYKHKIENDSNFISEFFINTTF
jgi:hypothetical protein